MIIYAQFTFYVIKNIFVAHIDVSQARHKWRTSHFAAILTPVVKFVLRSLSLAGGFTSRLLIDFYLK